MRRPSLRVTTLALAAALVVLAWVALAAWILDYPVPEAARLDAFDPRQVAATESGPAFTATELVVQRDVSDGSSWTLSAARMDWQGDDFLLLDVRMVEKGSEAPMAVAARRGQGDVLAATGGGWLLTSIVLSGSVEIDSSRGLAVRGEEMQLAPDRGILRSEMPAMIRFASGDEMHRLSWFLYDIKQDVLTTGLEEGQELLGDLEASRIP
ncbi:hypothetical protein HS125_02495 [bacterium]|nr:hypothetical protein [bacterium]